MIDSNMLAPEAREGTAFYGSLKDLLSRGEYLRAFEFGDTLLKEADRPDPEVVKLHALCMSRLGMTDKAVNLLESLEPGLREADPEIFALLGSFYKRKWLELKDTDPSAAGHLLSSSFHNYMKSRELGGDYWCVINAATLALFLGRVELGLELAEDTIGECWEEYNRHGTSSEYWIPVSMGEAYLIKREYNTAARWYRSARSHLCGRIGQIRSARLNAKMLIQLLETPEEAAENILQAIRKPRIVVFAGHRIDRPGRPSPRFPESVSGKVKSRVKKKLIELKPDIGIASAADGADLIFHECLNEMGRISHVVLPAPMDHFASKLKFSGGKRWADRFWKAIDSAHQIEVSSSSRFDCEADGPYQLAADYLIEYSLDVGRNFDAEVLPLVVWDELPSSHPGGTGYIVTRFRQLGYEPCRVSMASLVARSNSSGDASGRDPVFPYENWGIYEPAARPIAVVRPTDKGGSEELLASGLRGIAANITSICEDKSIRILSAGTISGSIYLLMHSTTGAWDLLSELSGSGADLPALSVVLHSGMSIMMDSSLTGRRDYYCREIDEALEIADTLRLPERIVTMQFRSISSDIMDKKTEASYLYHGLIRISTGSTLKLYRIVE
ncbi:MAG: tetratricopeptide repeat-containing protein [Candidatus Aegiribacteria sp.]